MSKMRLQRLNKKSIKWGWVAMAILAVVGVLSGLVGVKPTKAIEGGDEYWTVSNESGLTMTIVSVMQNEAEIAPVWSEYLYRGWTGSGDFGDYYFPVANSADEIRIGVIVDGMVEGKSYTVFNNEIITADNNGQAFYTEITPYASMQDSVECHYEDEMEHCSIYPLANEYQISANLHENGDGWDWLSRSLVIRPEHVGSRNVEIVSVKQNEQDLFLDTVGRQVTSLRVLQTINEYQVIDYNTPVEITYKLKNLEIGKSYSTNLLNNHSSFVADSTERVVTSEIMLDFTVKHVNIALSFYGPDSYSNEYVSIHFVTLDPNFVSLGDIIVDEISQNGIKIEPEATVSEYLREYVFSANDVMPIEVNLHATRAMVGLNYYIAYNMYGDNVYLNSDVSMVVTGSELEQGTVLTIPAVYGVEDGDILTLSLSVSTLSARTGYGGDTKTIYENYAENQYNTDVFKVSYYRDATLPRYEASMLYSDDGASETEVSDGMINARYHDAEHPLKVRVIGENYLDEQNYDAHFKVKYGTDVIYDRVFPTSGGELNSGIEYVLEGLTLTLPEYDPNSDNLAYDRAFEFSLSINGLEQKGYLYYMYNGWVYTVMTYAGGQVAATGGFVGMGAGPYLTGSSVTMSRSTLKEGATLHYVGGGYDDDLSYDYAIYYNSDAGEAWWSAVAGEKIREGVVTGRELNSGNLSIAVPAPDELTNNSMYTLVLTKNGGVVVVSRDAVIIRDDPMVESFSFRADSDSFVQTGRSSYRMARDNDAEMTIVGAGFDETSEYQVYVSYYGHRFVEEEEYSRDEPVDLSRFDSSVVVTGVVLNAGYSHALTYDEAFYEADAIEVVFAITDKGVARPERYTDTPTEGIYSGHMIYLEYVDANEVFNEGGFQIDEETSEIIDVSQPIEESGIPVDIKTPNDVQIHTEEDTLILVSNKSTLVIGRQDDRYELIEVASAIDDDGVKTNAYDMTGFDEAIVVLKGDIDMRGSLTARDSSKIDYCLLSDGNPNHRDLTALEMIIADVDGNGRITARDASLLDYALLSTDNPNYRGLTW